MSELTDRARQWLDDWPGPLRLVGNAGHKSVPDAHNAAPDLVCALLAEIDRLTPRVVETRDQLKALPVGSIVREEGSDGFALESYWDEIWQMPKWLYPGDDDPQTEPTLPATVLHTPEGGDL